MHTMCHRRSGAGEAPRGRLLIDSRRLDGYRCRTAGQPEPLVGRAARAAAHKIVGAERGPQDLGNQSNAQARRKLGCTSRPGKTTNSATASIPGRTKSRAPPVKLALVVQVSRPSPNWWSFPDG